LALDIGQRPAHIDGGDSDPRGQRAVEQPFAEPRRQLGREPVPYPADGLEPSPADRTASLPASPAAGSRPPAAPLELPASRDVETWVKAVATEIKGEDRARPLYHFEFWLEPPDHLRRRVVAVVYDFNTPAVMPQTQVSSEQKSGFRVSAGGLTCADKVTVTLKFDDGRTEQVVVDGCKLLS
jgi:hypothetical protein